MATIRRVNADGLDYDKFAKKFQEDEEKINNEILDHIARLSDIKEFVNCETFFHSKRQIIIKEISSYMDQVILLKQSCDVRKAEIINNITSEANGYNSNYMFKGSTEKNAIINGDNYVATINQFMELINSHIAYLDETKKTIDGIIFNMKYRFEIQKSITLC